MPTSESITYDPCDCIELTNALLAKHNTELGLVFNLSGGPTTIGIEPPSSRRDAARRLCASWRRIARSAARHMGRSHESHLPDPAAFPRPAGPDHAGAEIMSIGISQRGLRIAAGRIGCTPDDYLERVANGEAWCSRHHEWHARKAFGPGSQLSGLDHMCHEAQAEYKRSRRRLLSKARP